MAGTHLFVTENTASEGVIECPAASDPVQGLHRVETMTTKLGMKWKVREEGRVLLLFQPVKKQREHFQGKSNYDRDEANIGFYSFCR